MRTGWEEVGEETEPRHPADQADSAHRNASAARCFRIALLITGDQHGDRRRGHQCGAGLRTDGELAGRAENGIGHQRADRGPQSSDRGQSGYLRVRHHLRNQVSRDRHSSETPRSPAGSGVSGIVSGAIRGCTVDTGRPCQAPGRRGGPLARTNLVVTARWSRRRGWSAPGRPHNPDAQNGERYAQGNPPRRQ